VGATLAGASFDEVRAMNAYFEGASCRSASFRNARLSYADLDQCDLSGSDFTGSVLDGATLGGADLRGALMLWKSFASPNLSGAIFDATTIWPKGFDVASLLGG